MADRKVLYNVLKMLGYAEIELIEMPDKKRLDTTEFTEHKITSYEVIFHEHEKLRHSESFINDYLKCLRKRFMEI